MWSLRRLTLGETRREGLWVKSALQPQLRRSFTGKALTGWTNPSNAEGTAGGAGAEASRVPRRLQTLAIESSCDDTSVAVLSISAPGYSHELRTDVLFHEKVTASSEGYGGIHPLVALHSHQCELGPLVQRAIKHLKPSGRQMDGSSVDRSFKPDFVSVTRGPGMRSNLSVGLDTAKGLAAAWNVPLIGIHHMQAHALTSRLCSTLNSASVPGRVLYQPDDVVDGKDHRRSWTASDLGPRFPFLTVLASGGHTMLINSKSLVEHQILAETKDIALGDLLDKSARTILYDEERKMPFGKALEEFAFPDGQYKYSAPVTRAQELEGRISEWGWTLRPPLSQTKAGEKSNKRMEYSFAGLLSSVQRYIFQNADGKGTLKKTVSGRDLTGDDERRALAIEVQRVAFEHLGSRILLYLSDASAADVQQLRTIVVSGGVAANRYLRHVLRSMLDARGYGHIELSFPPPALCTDNALMIAWAGMEMFDAGYTSELSIQPLKKWNMDPTSNDGGILGVGGWTSIVDGR